MTTKFENVLNKFSENDWFSILTKLLPDIHEVDRNAVQIWFRFYPLELFRALQAAENKDELLQKFVMQGNYELKNQIDASHKFLYGHRYWKNVKEAIEKRVENFSDENADLANETKQIAKTVAEKVKANESLLLGITAVGLMILVQSGLENFKNAKGAIEKPKGLMKNSPEKILAERAKDDSQGLFGFLKTIDKKWTVTYDETASDARFKLVHDEEIASASARDQSKNWREKDERCIEGVVPVECRSAACGTCWIGILSGAEKLTEVSTRERKQMKVFGYKQPEDAKPFLRLACQARAHGAISIVIPPWNGVFGKKVYRNVEDVELEPATTSAAKLRETITTATENN
ncbi:MAG: 2Fe-2S iron-sulfur cluster binding domain-containing protein [Acidobacteria bacterium]|nr:2Fe-2S iron-sulfur cluster binding domain-containing protein [Acidobacteriota bacterium]MCA1638024.1 2Fe-2S iron-sulfur cluster binding domain-containing protein [Acidobacteriota bacterium]